MSDRGAITERLSPASDATLAHLSEEFTDIDVMAHLQRAIAD
jgi:hypothetical protein